MQDLPSAVGYFPLVGGGLGIALIFTDWASARSFPRVSHLISAALILVVYAFFTGGLHHDGLIDVADAFWGWRSRGERFRIMKDSRAGALGVTALLLLLIVELSAIYALPVHMEGASGRFRWAALLAFPVLGRWIMSYQCVRFPYAREEGTGSAMVRGSQARHLVMATMITLAILVGVFVFLVRIPLLIPALAVYALAFAEMTGGLFTRSVGGVTGDTIGASAMLGEGLVLVLLVSRIPGLLAG